MGKTSTKQLLKVVTTLVDNLPEDELEKFDSETAQAIIDGRQNSGREFMRFLKNRARVHVVGNHVIDCSAEPFIPDNWKVEEHTKAGDFTWDPNTVTLYLSKHQKNRLVFRHRSIRGHGLRDELKGKPVLNACVLDYLLVHTQLIPEEWKGKNVFFWGTIYRSFARFLAVRYLFWHEQRWNWGSYCLGDEWNDEKLAAVSVGV